MIRLLCRRFAPSATSPKSTRICSKPLADTKLYSHIERRLPNPKDNRAHIKRLVRKKIPKNKRYGYMRGCRFSNTDKHMPDGEALWTGIKPLRRSTHSLPETPYRSSVGATHSPADYVKHANNQWYEDGLVSADTPLVTPDCMLKTMSVSLASAAIDQRNAHTLTNV
jgi:hypothetical protein